MTHDLKSQIIAPWRSLPQFAKIYLYAAIGAGIVLFLSYQLAVFFSNSSGTGKIVVVAILAAFFFFPTSASRRKKIGRDAPRRRSLAVAFLSFSARTLYFIAVSGFLAKSPRKEQDKHKEF